MIWIVKTLVRSCRIPGCRSGQSTRLSQPRLHLVGHTHRALLARQPTGQRLSLGPTSPFMNAAFVLSGILLLARRGRHFPGHLRNEPTGAVDLRRLACPFTGGSHRVRHLYARVHDASFVGLRTGPRKPNCENRASRNSPNLAVALNCGDRVQFLECRGERIRKTPDRSRPEFLVLRLEVKVMHGAGKVLWSFQSAFDKGLVDNHLGRHVRQFTSLPGFHLLSHRLEVSPHSIDAHRDAVDE